MKGDTMRPLIEILEDERKIMQRLESVYRFMTRTYDTESLDILNFKRESLVRDLNENRDEIREYITGLFNGGDER